MAIDKKIHIAAAEIASRSGTSETQVPRDTALHRPVAQPQECCRGRD